MISRACGNPAKRMCELKVFLDTRLNQSGEIEFIIGVQLGRAKPQPESPMFQWVMRRHEFPTGTLDPRAGFLRFSLKTNDTLFFSHIIQFWHSIYLP